jgi:hypothetical protein
MQYKWQNLNCTENLLLKNSIYTFKTLSEFAEKIVYDPRNVRRQTGLVLSLT